MIALIGTPSGSSQNFDSTGLFVIGAVKREFGCAAFSVELWRPRVALASR